MCSYCVPVAMSVEDTNLTFLEKSSKQITLDPILVMGKLSFLCSVLGGSPFPPVQRCHLHQGFQA